MAAIYNWEDGSAISEGLQGCEVCDEAIRAAKVIAADRHQTVLLDDDDGEWAVHPDGHLDSVSGIG